MNTQLPKITLTPIGGQINGQTVTKQTVMDLLEQDTTQFAWHKGTNKLDNETIGNFVISNEQGEKVGVISLGLRGRKLKQTANKFKEFWENKSLTNFALAFWSLSQHPLWIKNRGTIYHVFVLDKFKGQRYGKALIKAIEEKAREERIKVIRAAIHSNNPKMLELVKSFGWSRAGIQTVFQMLGKRDRQERVFKKRLK